MLRTDAELWKVWTQESYQKVEFDRPGERSPSCKTSSEKRRTNTHILLITNPFWVN